MAMSAGGHVSESPAWLAPIGWVGRAASGTLSYLGATALLTISAAVSTVRAAMSRCWS